jgi:hypothetical protein
MSVFADEKYITAYHKTGEFPKIHDPIAEMVKMHANEDEPVLDLGSCTGLLPIRLVEECNRSFAVGLEPNRKYIDKAPRHQHVGLVCMGVERSTLPQIAGIMDFRKPTLLTARRVLPEIHATDPQVLEMFVHLCYTKGIEKVILQGRVKVKNARTPLDDIYKEAKVFESHYVVGQINRQTALLVKR